MKTKEMIKEITENPEKEFIRTRDGLVIRTDEKGYLRWEEGYNWINLLRLGDDPILLYAAARMRMFNLEEFENYTGVKSEIRRLNK